MKMLGKYEMLEKLGEGVNGPVYRAYDASSKREVAIRSVGPLAKSDPALNERLVAESRAILELKHPNIMPVYEMVNHEGIAYSATDLLPGKDLKTLIAESTPITVEQKLRIIAQAAGGIGFAHGRGLMHGSVCPQNIHVLPDGTVRVLALGIAGLLAPHIERLGNQWGSPAYLAPEQLRDKVLTPQSDIYSLGIVFYEFLTGKHPFPDSRDAAPPDDQPDGPNFPTVEQFPALPVGLWPILKKCLAEDREERYAGMDDLSADCRRLLEELAEDSELMRFELQRALPKLRNAVESPNATPKLAQLLSRIESTLATRKKDDYQSFDSLLAALAEQNHLLHSAASHSTSPAGELVEPAADLKMSGSMDKAAGPPAPDLLTDRSKRAAASEVVDPPLESARQPDAAAASSHEKVQGIDERGNRAVRAEAAPTDHSPGLPPRIDAGQDRIQAAVEGSLPEQQAQPGPTNPPAESAQLDQPAPPAAQPPLPPVETPDKEAGTTATGPEIFQSCPIDVENTESDVAPSIAGDANADSLPPVQHWRGLWRMSLWVCCACLMLAFAVAVPSWIHSRSGASIGASVWSWVQRTAGLRPSSPPGASADASAIAQRDRLNFARRDILLEEAQVLHVVGRDQESRIFLNRLLELYPGYQPALQELERIDANTGQMGQDPNRNQAVARLLGSALASMKIGRLDAAQADIEKAEQLQPGLADVAAAHKLLEARRSEAAAGLAREQAKLREEADRQKLADSLKGRAEDLYKGGNYDGALAVLAVQPASTPASPVVEDLRLRASEAQRSLRDYESALSNGKYSDATAALEKLERINPTDPNLPNLRRRAESRATASRASLSLFALGEAATLMIDSETIGANGELTEQTIPAGRHRLTARSRQGTEVTLAYDFSDGQKVAFVYDVARQLFRPMAETDRETINRNRARQQVHTFAVEHNHGLFRGSCKGSLLVSFFDVVYRPESGAHGFSVPFRTLKVRIDNRTVSFLFAADNKEFESFRLNDATAAQSLKTLWDGLAALGK